MLKRRKHAVLITSLFAAAADWAVASAMRQERRNLDLIRAIRVGDESASVAAMESGADPFVILRLNENGGSVWRHLMDSLGSHTPAVRSDPIATAFRYQCFGVARALLKLGAKPTNASVDNHRMSALTYDAHEGQTDLVRMLLHSGADVTATHEYGETALSLAQENGRSDIVSLLKAAGEQN